jgi:hypothetical protein
LISTKNKCLPLFKGNRSLRQALHQEISFDRSRDLPEGFLRGTKKLFSAGFADFQVSRGSVGLARGGFRLTVERAARHRELTSAPLETRHSKQQALGWRRFAFQWLPTFRIIVLSLIDSRAYRVPPHQRGVERLQHLGKRNRVSEGWVQPKIVVVRAQDNRHSVVNIEQERIWSRCDDRAALDYIALWTLPSVPETSEREQIAAVSLEAIRLLGGPGRVGSH